MISENNPLYTEESLIYKNRVKRFSLYLLVLLALLVVVGLLPVIKIDISSQGRGMVRSEAENVPLMSMVSGKITKLNLKNNLNVNKGDTLVVITQENLQTEKQTTQNLSGEVSGLLHDLALVVQNKSQNLKTSAISQEWQSYQTRYAELLSKKEQSGAVYERHKCCMTMV